MFRLSDGRYNRTERSFRAGDSLIVRGGCRIIYSIPLCCFLTPLNGQSMGTIMKIILRSLTAGFLATTCLTTLSYAAKTKDINMSNDTLEEVIVTANRRNQPLSEIGTSMSVISDADIALGQYNYVLDALADTPGVSISQNGSFGGTASVSIRGAGGDNTVILVDGVQLNDPSSPGGSYNFAGLDPYNISRIEVLRGPQSVLYGSDAIGGVINVITKTGTEGFGGNLFGEFGSYNSFRGGAALFGGTKTLGYNFTVSGTSSDGVSAADENDGNTEKDAYKAFTLSSKMTFQPKDTFGGEIIARYADNRGEFDSFEPVDGDMVSYFDEFMIAGRAKLDLLDDRFSNVVSVEYSSIDRRSETNGAESFTAEGTRVNIDYLGVYTPVKGWTITAGAQHEETKAVTTDPKSFALNSLLGEIAYTQLEGLVLTGGLRFDDHDTFGSELTARVTGSYAIKETNSRIIANWSEGFKAPSIFQLTFICDFCGLTEPTANLQPERADSFEIGIEQSLFDDNLSLSAAFFHQNAENAIIFTFAGGYQNLGRSQSKGVEISLDANIAENVSIRSNYTLTDAIDRDTGDKRLLQPKHELYGAIFWSPTTKFLANLSATYNSEEIAFGDSTIDGWIRVDLRASYNISDTLQVYGRLDNVLNKEYQHVTGYGTADRSVYVGLRTNF